MPQTEAHLQVRLLQAHLLHAFADWVQGEHRAVDIADQGLHAGQRSHQVVIIGALVARYTCLTEALQNRRVLREDGS